MGRGFAGLDPGTREALSDASIFVEALEKRKGFNLAYHEGIAFCNVWISHEKDAKIGTTHA